ncbi:probable CCR4-associated factor 1 homolog 9 [Corylus avellana]|uniref:probable CCR4-associated factor 1 homolog 9 n=1 Tax=Corylus avellana TaxID=13451 RepID=UPI00286CDFE7|nr:probable CCR4-associated factor 1 homolog 9 [Corylus avellana]
MTDIFGDYLYIMRHSKSPIGIRKSETQLDDLSGIHDPRELGLPLSDPNRDSCYVWEFNFNDKESDLHNSEFIQLLERKGIDFNKNREKGIESKEFARLIFDSGLLWNSKIAWDTFHNAYDFGYVVKILTGRLVYLFGYKVFDIKHMIKSCEGMYGGLEKVVHDDIIRWILIVC